MAWTIEEMRRRPGVADAESHLFSLMRASGKTRFGVARDHDSYNQPCIHGYGIALQLDHPYCDIIYLHELFHGILLEEQYPTAWSSERPESDDTTNTILWNFTNTVHHVEIFQRMARGGANLDHYFAYRAEETLHKVRRIAATGDSTFASRNMDCLVLFDTFLMGRHGEAVQAAYRQHATRSLEACADIYREVERIGCGSPGAALASAKVFQAVMARYCRRFGAPEQFARFWDSIEYPTLSQRHDLPPCPEWVRPIEAPPRNSTSPDDLPRESYSHTQRAPLYLLLSASALVCFVLGWLIGDTLGIYIGSGVGLLIGLLASCFHHLAVEDHGDVLEVRFGPVPLFRRTVQYADIGSVEAGRTLLLDGWGIHYSIRGGWVWNLWGRTCVVVRFKNGGTLRIGTDDAENLVEFLRSKVQA